MSSSPSQSPEIPQNNRGRADPTACMRLDAIEFEAAIPESCYTERMFRKAMAMGTWLLQRELLERARQQAKQLVFLSTQSLILFLLVFLGCQAKEQKPLITTSR